MTNIRTRWQRISELIEQGEVYFTAPKGGTSVPIEDVGGEVKAVKGWVDAIGRHVPKFVIDPELIKLSNDDEFHKSLLDMKKAGVLRLPYPAMLIEMSVGKITYFVFLRDCQNMEALLPWETRELVANGIEAEHQSVPFYGYPVEIRSDDEGQYLVVSPSIDWVGVTEQDGKPWIKISSSEADIFDKKSRMQPGMRAAQERLVLDTYRKSAGTVGRALFVALLLMATQGVEKEVIETHKLNKKRIASGKQSIIPAHTYIHIGRVYKRDGTDAADESERYNARKPPRIHWRRGHSRRVRFGKGRTGSVWRFFPGRLVAVPPGMSAPKDVPFPEYHVKI